MLSRLLSTVLLCSTALAQLNGTEKCAATAPCSSEFGWCGTSAAFCLGGCDPLRSYKKSSCAPNPICLPGTTDFTSPASLNKIQYNLESYDGNASTWDWTLDKGALVNRDDGVALTLNQEGGTRLSSTRYMLYGSVTARLKTSSAAGVVSAFILMSDVKDEIDVEMPGASRTEFQTNYFHLGNADYANGVGTTVRDLDDTKANFFDYTISWTPEAITWSVNGNVTTTVTRESTKNEKGVSEYPSTPSRVQISLWPGGTNASAPGTIEWAGGMIDWDTDEMRTTGFYSMVLQSVAIECADKTPLTNASIVSYAYTDDNNSTESPVAELSTRSTLLGGAESSLVISRMTALLAMGGFISLLL